MIERLSLTCSFVLLCAFAGAQSDAEWIEQAKQLDPKNRAAVESFLDRLSSAYAESNDSALQEIIADQKSALRGRRSPDLDSIVARLEVRRMFSGRGSSTANGTAKRVLANNVFRDSDEPTGRNWLSRAFERLAQLLSSPEQPEIEVRELPVINVRPIAYLLIALLVIGIIALFAFAVRASWFRKSARAGLHKRAILDEDEPDRTLDEWLVLAERLQREGKYREVVRCLYVATLLRLDAGGIIRFERSETNWEHLARIEMSNAPPGIEYRTLTQKFDLIWYGRRPASLEDCDYMRAQYQELCRLLRDTA